jgi:protein-disulfide isomerase
MSLSRRTLLPAALAAALAVRGQASATEAEQMTLGAANAPLHLIEYASAICPHCAHFHETNWATLKSAYIDAGRVRFTLHEMVTPPPAVALAMFQLARCGDSGADEYFRRLGVMFEQRARILETGTVAGVRDTLVALGGRWGLSAAQVMASLNDQQGVERMRRSIEEATRAGVSSTPTFIAAGELITDQDFHTPEGMRRILDYRLSRR